MTTRLIAQLIPKFFKLDQDINVNLSSTCSPYESLPPGFKLPLPSLKKISDYMAGFPIQKWNDFIGKVRTATPVNFCGCHLLSRPHVRNFLIDYISHYEARFDVYATPTSFLGTNIFAGSQWDYKLNGGLIPNIHKLTFHLTANLFMSKAPFFILYAKVMKYFLFFWSFLPHLFLTSILGKASCHSTLSVALKVFHRF